MSSRMGGGTRGFVARVACSTRLFKVASLFVGETVRHRRRFLRERITALAARIEADQREDEVAALAARVRQGSPLGPLPTSDEEWPLLLGPEQAELLPAYYLKLRAELALLNGQG